MKKIFNFLKNLLILVYVIIVVFVTICLLSYNDYKITVLGDVSIVPVTDDDLEPNYKLGDLLIVKKNKLEEVRSGDEIFFYRTQSGETSIYFGKVTNSERVTDTEYTYTVEGGYRLSSSKFIGKTSTTTLIPKVGRALSVIESKWGFLFIVVLPTLIMFLYTLYSVMIEAREGEKEEITLRKDDSSKDVETEKPLAETEVEKPSQELKSEAEEHANEEETKEIVQEEKEEAAPEEKELEENAHEEKTEEEKRRELVEAKLNSMTEEEKKALIRAKLNSMTEEEKRALLEQKRKSKPE